MSDRIRVLIPIGISLPCMFLCVASVYFANLPRVSPILQASVPLASEFYLVDIRDSLLKSHMYLVVSQLIPHWKSILLLSLSLYRSPSRASVVLVVLEDRVGIRRAQSVVFYSTLFSVGCGHLPVGFVSEPCCFPSPIFREHSWTHSFSLPLGSNESRLLFSV